MIFCSAARKGIITPIKDIWNSVRGHGRVNVKLGILEVKIGW